MGGVQHGHPLAIERFDRNQNVPAALRINANRRLVHDDHLGVVQQRRADVYPWIANLFSIVRYSFGRNATPRKVRARSKNSS